MYFKTYSGTNDTLGRNLAGCCSASACLISFNNISTLENPSVINIGSYANTNVTQGWATFDNSLTKYNKLTVTGDKYAICNMDNGQVVIADNYTGTNTIDITGISKVQIIARSSVSAISWGY